jgi:hypothetical protein
MKTSILILLTLSVTTLASAGETRETYTRAFNVVTIEDVTYKNLPFLAVTADELLLNDKAPGTVEAKQTERGNFVCRYFGYGDAFLSEIIWEPNLTRAWETSEHGGASFLQLRKLRSSNAVFTKIICLKRDSKTQTRDADAAGAKRTGATHDDGQPRATETPGHRLAD